MTKHRKRSLVSVMAVGAIVALASGAAADGPSRAAGTPHIVAQPNNLMVNGTSQLTGTGFPANSKVNLRECGAKNWDVPKKACDSKNAVTVTTNADGGFMTTMTIQLCPRLVPPKPPVTRERCYVGEPHPSGKDAITLVGAVKIIVTYP